MPRPKLTHEQRATRVADDAQSLTDSIGVALAAQSDPSVTPAEREALWGVVAGLAGNVQRQTRLLAGLGRGG